MGRRIVFVGGLQTRALARLYRSEAAGQAGDDVVFIGTGAVGSEQARATLLLADVVAMEVDEDGDAVPAADLPSRAEIVRVPNLYADYLWPFAGSAHPRNRGAFALPGGPYPGEHGDRFLDKMVAENVGEAEAIRRYLAIDMLAEGELDGRLIDRHAIQQRLDAASGYDLAGYVLDNFRTEKLFATRQRITMPLLKRVTAQLFEKLGVRGWNPESLRRVPFPAGAQPVHPAVIAHFGITWATPASRYPVNEEGFFGFEEFCGRYMRFAWNETLHRGIQTAKTRPVEAIDDLEAGLRESPDSPLGQLALRVARHEAGLGGTPLGPDEAIDEDSYLPVSRMADRPAFSIQAAPPAPPAPAAPAPAAEAEAEADTAEDTTGEAIAVELPQAEPEYLAPDEADFPAEAEYLAPAEPAAGEDGAAAPETAHDPAPEPEAAPERPAARFGAPGKPANMQAAPEAAIPPGFTDFRPAPPPPPVEDALATPGSELIEALPHLLPVFRDLSSAVDRPYDAMPEMMPPPPLRPILPPEVPGEPVKQGFLDRLLGRKNG